MKNQNIPLASSFNLRRQRENKLVRSLLRPLDLRVEQFIQPIFLVEGIDRAESIPGMPQVFRDNKESLLFQIESDLKKGVSHFLLFGVPASKGNLKRAWDFTASQIEGIKKRFGSQICLWLDVCLCSQTEHGHCGHFLERPYAEHLQIDPSLSVQSLADQALLFAQAGADAVAPSDMMDGRILAIREKLNQNGYAHVLLMSYSAKFHSCLYGPFRIAASSAPKSQGNAKYPEDRSSYQIDPSFSSDAIRSSLRDEQEGADLLMVKPAMWYLDILFQLSQISQVPLAAYQVSGEYAGIEAMVEKGLVDRQRAHLESWVALRRAGASVLITYAARNAKDWIEKWNT